jgi:UDP-GlcNAc:undecaprenyl-phosphate GlcNAc-1-phosphate transferase
MLGVLAIPMTVFSLVGVINAVNMADGMDGLAGSYLLVCLGAVAGLHAMAGNHGIDATLALAGAACLLPFLLLNLRLPWQRRARVFLGDAGSMAIGLLVGVLLIRGSQGADAAFAPPVALWLLAVPLIDTVSVMLRRIAAGRSPFAADQQHVHHVLLRTGLDVPQVWRILLGSAALLALAGMAAHGLGLPQSLQFGLFMLIACSYHGWVCSSLRAGRALGRVLHPQLSKF